MDENRLLNRKSPEKSTPYEKIRGENPATSKVQNIRKLISQKTQ